MSMKEVYILSAVRTPIGKFGGGLAGFSATQLGSFAIAESVKRAGVEIGLVQEVIMGNVLSANLGQAPARQAALGAGISNDAVCTTVNKVCASGMKAIAMGIQSIVMGDADCVVAGGMESMSNVPYYVDSLRWGSKYGDRNIIDGLAKDGLTDPYDKQAMGLAAEHCASSCNISREEQDQYAIDAYKRAQSAWDQGKFNDEIIPLSIPQKKGAPILMEKDEEPWSVVFDKIPGLQPAFKKEGTVTAANASTMNDGAAALVLMSKEKAEALGLKPIAIVMGYADAEQEPVWFTTSPALALPKAIEKAGLNKEQIDLWEINEAFSVVSIENAKRMGIIHDQLNIHGGAVSIGHPLGCSGARIVVTLIHALKQNKLTYGAAGICNGGGGASAMVLRVPK
ncbi:MAG: acetyl-CoA C-acyltransferase [Chitinophagaceae bacterium]|nr:acetyl-CoA C-acyltransferase [Chitinophagaceae bacterium]